MVCMLPVLSTANASLWGRSSTTLKPAFCNAWLACSQRGRGAISLVTTAPGTVLRVRWRTTQPDGLASHLLLQ
jgi:hypothetical protein